MAADFSAETALPTVRPFDFAVLDHDHTVALFELNLAQRSFHVQHFFHLREA
jgi:hypothetical protein